MVRELVLKGVRGRCGLLTRQGHYQLPTRRCAHFVVFISATYSSQSPILFPFPTINQSTIQSSWRTNIVFPAKTSILRASKNSASSIPAGHSWPPQPSFASDSRRSGGESRPWKECEVVVGRMGGREGMRSSEMVMRGGEREGEGGDVMVWVDGRL